MLCWRLHVCRRPSVHVILSSTQEKPISNPSFVRVLIVDDFDAWKQYVLEKLQQNPILHVVDFASDGLEAVRKALELKPDLILLDIGLPGLCGIEAAKQIRNLLPESKIIFLTQERSTDVVQAALNSGAQGYVFKTSAECHLLAAVEAVISGKQFVS